MQVYTPDLLSQTQMGRYLTAREGDFISKCLQQQAGAHSILDVGGGSGRFAIPLQSQGYQVTVTEVRRVALWYLRDRNSQINGVLTSQRTCGWPMRDGAADCVLAIGIDSIVRQAWFWQECRRILKPDGVVIFNMTNSRSYKGSLYKLRGILRPFLSEKGRIWADRKIIYGQPVLTVVHLFQEAGFQLCLAQGYNWLPAMHNSESALISLFARVERILHLRNLPFQSPWVILKAQKRA